MVHPVLSSRHHRPTASTASTASNFSADLRSSASESPSPTGCISPISMNSLADSQESDQSPESPPACGKESPDVQILFGAPRASTPPPRSNREAPPNGETHRSDGTTGPALFAAHSKVPNLDEGKVLQELFGAFARLNPKTQTSAPDSPLDPKTPTSAPDSYQEFVLLQVEKTFAQKIAHRKDHSWRYRPTKLQKMVFALLKQKDVVSGDFLQKFESCLTEMKASLEVEKTHSNFLAIIEALVEIEFYQKFLIPCLKLSSDKAKLADPSAENLLEQIKKNLKLLDDLHKTKKGVHGVLQADPAFQQNSPEGLAHSIWLNVFNDKSPSSDLIARNLEGGVQNTHNLDVLGGDVVFSNVVAGVISSFYRQYGRHAKDIVYLKEKVLRKTTRQLFQKLKGKEGDSPPRVLAIYQDKAEKLGVKIERFPATVPPSSSTGEPTNQQAMTLTDRLKDDPILLKSFLKSKLKAYKLGYYHHEFIKKDAENILAQLRQSAGENGTTIDTMVFKLNNRRGRFFEHIIWAMKDIDAPSDVIQEFIGAYVSQRQHSRESSEGGESQPRQPDEVFLDTLATIHTKLATINTDRPASVETFFEICKDIIVNIKLSSDEKLNLYKELSYFHEQGLKGEGPLAPLFEKRSTLWSDLWANIIGYAGFDTQKIGKAAEAHHGVVATQVGGVSVIAIVYGIIKWLVASMMAPISRFWFVNHTTTSDSCKSMLKIYIDIATAEKKNPTNQETLSAKKNSTNQEIESSSNTPELISIEKFLKKFKEALDKKGQKQVVEGTPTAATTSVLVPPPQSLADNLDALLQRLNPTQRRALLEYHNQSQDCLLIQLSHVLKPQEFSDIFNKYYYQPPSQKRNLPSQERNFYGFLSFQKEILDQTVDPTLVGPKKQLSKDKAQLLFLSLKNYIQQMPSHTTDTEIQLCKKELARFYVSSTQPGGSLKIIRQETRAMTCVKQVLSGFAVGGQWGFFQALLNGMVSATGVAVFTIACFSPGTLVGFSAVILISSIGMISCGLRIMFYYKRAELEFSDKTPANQFVYSKLTEDDFLTEEDLKEARAEWDSFNQPITLKINESVIKAKVAEIEAAAAAQQLSLVDDEQVSQEKVLQEKVLELLKEATDKKSILVALTRIKGLLKNSTVNVVTKSQIVDALLAELNSGKSLLLGELENLAWHQTRYDGWAFIAGGVAAGGMAAAMITSFWESTLNCFLPGLGTALWVVVGIVMQIFGDVFAGRALSGVDEKRKHKGVAYEMAKTILKEAKRQ